MSDLLAAAAEALGVPEAIVSRSAEARATATGATVDEVLTAWAEGGDITTEAPAAEPAPVEDTEEQAEALDQPVPEAPEEPTTETPQPAEPAAEKPAPPPTRPAPQPLAPEPPVAPAAPDRPALVLAASIGLFLFAVVASLLAPALGGADTGPRTSRLELSALAVKGRDAYAASGCGSCHTQMVRPVIADVGLGAVTLSDSNQVLGTRRYGPDLSNAGARLSGSQIDAIIGGFGGHPAVRLGGAQTEALVAYLAESTTMEAGDE